MYMACSKSSVCCGHNVFIWTAYLSVVQVIIMHACMNLGRLGDRVEFCFRLLSVDLMYLILFNLFLSYNNTIYQNYGLSSSS